MLFLFSPAEKIVCFSLFFFDPNPFLKLTDSQNQADVWQAIFTFISSTEYVILMSKMHFFLVKINVQISEM